MPDEVDVSLKEYLEALLEIRIAFQRTQLEHFQDESQSHVDQLRHEMDILGHAQQTAIDKAERATDARFASVNEFREQLRAQAGTFAVKDSVEKEFLQARRSADGLGERIRFIESTYALREPTERSFRELERQIEHARSRDLPRETFESTMSSWTEWRNQVDSRINQWAGRDSEVTRGQNRGEDRMLWAWGAAVSFLTTVAVILATILATQ